MGVITLFAFLYYIISQTLDCNLGLVNLGEAFYFSLETMATVGYGTQDIYFDDCWSVGSLLSLQVCVKLIADALTIGVIIGLISGFYGGKIESFLMRIVDIQLSFPAILVALVLLALLGKGIDKVIIALAIVQWAIYARTVRAAAIVERNKEYIQAASCLGLSNSLIIWKHLLPNSISPLIVLATLQTAHSISIEATLSFLGVGVPITEPSLGSLISNGFDFILSGAYWITFFPGLMLLATVAAINIFGDQLRIILNPRVNR